MGILTTQDKEKIKRAVPKTSNKVIDATVARLYIAYPDPTKWVFTGLMGAIALVDDLVGHTFFLKMVDITGHRGVIWDQELYVNFEYNQDRKFFHTFEIEDCLVGLLFEDTNDATHFHKRVTTRQKHGSSATVKNKNAIALKEKVGPKTHNAPGPRGEFMDVNTAQRQRRAKGVLYYDDVPPPEWRSLYAELEAAGITEDMIVDNRQFIKDYIAQQGGPLVGLEPPVPRKYQSAHERALNNEAPASSSASTTTTTEHASFTKHKKAPPPPPPTQTPSSSSPAPGAPGISNAASSGYGHSTPESHSSMSPSTETPDPENEAGNEPAKFKPVFRVPPMDKLPQRAASQTSSSTNTERPLPAPPSAAPSFNPQPTTTSAPHSAAPSQPAQTRKPFAVPPPFVPNPAQQAPQAYQTPQQTNQGPPAPPSRGGAPPPPPRAGMSNSGSPAPPPRNAGLTPMKTGGAGPPPPPPPARGSRGPAPPPPPSRSSAVQQQQQQTAHSTPPPLHQRPQVAIPIQTQNPNQPGLTSPPPPPRPGQFTSPPPPTRPAQALPQQTQVPAPIPNSFPTQIQTQTQTQTQPSQSAPPPPPLPQSMSTGGGAVPPPPPPPPAPAMSTGSAPPAPPAPPAMSTGAAPMSNGGSLPEATGDAGRDALLASIRGAGIGALKKTDKSQLDKPSVLLQEARGEPVSTQPTGGASGGGGAPPGSLADALSAALSKRKEKVAHSDDEDDEW